MIRGKSLFNSTTADYLPSGELLRLRLSKLDNHLTTQLYDIKNPALSALYKSLFGENSKYGMKKPESLVDLIAQEASADYGIPIDQVSYIFEQLLVYLAPYIKPSVEDYVETELTSSLRIKQYHDRINDRIEDERIATLNTDLDLPLAIISPESVSHLLKGPTEVFFVKQARSRTMHFSKESFDGFAQLAIILLTDYLNSYKKHLENISPSGNKWLEYGNASSNLYTIMSHYRLFFRDLIPYLPAELANSEQLTQFSALLKKDIVFKKSSKYPDFEADHALYESSIKYLMQIGDLFHISPTAFSHLTQTSFDPEACYGCDTIDDYLGYQRSAQVEHEEKLNNAIKRAFEQKRMHDFGAMRMIFNRMKAHTVYEMNQLKSEWDGIGDEIDYMQKVIAQMLGRLEKMKPVIENLNVRVNRVHDKHEETEECLDSMESKQI